MTARIVFLVDRYGEYMAQNVDTRQKFTVKCYFRPILSVIVYSIKYSMKSFRVDNKSVDVFCVDSVESIERAPFHKELCVPCGFSDGFATLQEAKAAATTIRRGHYLVVWHQFDRFVVLFDLYRTWYDDYEFFQFVLDNDLLTVSRPEQLVIWHSKWRLDASELRCLPDISIQFCDRVAIIQEMKEAMKRTNSSTVRENGFYSIKRTVRDIGGTIGGLIQDGMVIAKLDEGGNRVLALKPTTELVVELREAEPADVRIQLNEAWTHSGSSSSSLDPPTEFITLDNIPKPGDRRIRVLKWSNIQDTVNFLKLQRVLFVFPEEGRISPGRVWCELNDFKLHYRPFIETATGELVFARASPRGGYLIDRPSSREKGESQLSVNCITTRFRSFQTCSVNDTLSVDLTSFQAVFFFTDHRQERWERYLDIAVGPGVVLCLIGKGDS